MSSSGIPTPQPSSVLMPPPSAPPPSHIIPTPSPQLPSPSPSPSMSGQQSSSNIYSHPVSSPRTPMSASAESLGIIPQLQYVCAAIYVHLFICHYIIEISSLL